MRADGVAWLQAALVHDLVCRTSYPTCSSVSCWVAKAGQQLTDEQVGQLVQRTTCSTCASIAAWSSSTPTLPPTHLSPATQLPPHECQCLCCAPKVSPQPYCETVPIGLLLAASSASSSARSAFACWLGRLPCCSAVAADCFPNSPSGATGAVAAAAAAAAAAVG